ncbi:MAG: hypothetical protein JNK52_06910 [Zoogloeaceae bacterium]|nr:hypothetical protein [Zoogloeaceae bacterium]
MNNIPFPVIVAVLFFLGADLVLYLHHRHQKRQRALPEQNDYMRDHGQHAPACIACGATELDEAGCCHATDTRRIVRCATCRTMLFQFQRPEVVSPD